MIAVNKQPKVSAPQLTVDLFKRRALTLRIEPLVWDLLPEPATTCKTSVRKSVLMW